MADPATTTTDSTWLYVVLVTLLFLIAAVQVVGSSPRAYARLTVIAQSAHAAWPSARAALIGATMTILTAARPSIAPVQKGGRHRAGNTRYVGRAHCPTLWVWPERLTPADDHSGATPWPTLNTLRIYNGSYPVKRTTPPVAIDPPPAVEVFSYLYPVLSWAASHV